MFKTGSRGRRVAAFVTLVWAGLALTGCDGKPSYNHSGGIVDGWPVWGHGAAGQRHSANTQIAPDNVKDLQVAWTYRTGDLSRPGEHADLAFEATPILANNTLYLCSPRSRIIALDPTTGKQKWMFDAHPNTFGSTVIVCRGVSYWKDSQASGKQCSQRIFGGTIDGNIDYPGNQVRMRGTFVPMYGLNNIFGQIPIVGLFLGGGSNEGLIGVTYEVVGTVGQPVLNINPISAMAPGVLRKIFEFNPGRQPNNNPADFPPNN